jgi:hypothetical protein
LSSVACSGRPTVAGYWEGKGHASETPMKDDYKELTRTAEYKFWFTLDEEGNAVGEAEITYDAVLTVENLPQVSAPTPAGTITFAPQVGGQLTDLDPKRRFPIVGFLDKEEMTLVLAIAVKEEEREPIEFTLRADPGVSVGVGAGGLSATVPGGGVGTIVKKINMTPFDVFFAQARVEKRPSGPYAARFEEKGENYAMEWSARQMGGEQRQQRLEITPEIEQALRELKQRLQE